MFFVFRSVCLLVEFKCLQTFFFKYQSINKLASRTSVTKRKLGNDSFLSNNVFVFVSFTFKLNSSAI